ncbi:MAG: FAD-dependent oxidoreductase [bacterium]
MDIREHLPTIIEPARALPVLDEVDLCVLGGSCTGVFAAVAAARLRLRVVLVERQNCFGGVATAGMVYVWHSLYDTLGEKLIISGLTLETVERLEKRGAVLRYAVTNEDHGFELNTEELKIELDELVREAGVIPRLHTVFVAPYVEDGRLAAVIVEDKTGRGVIRARSFIDATGDGDLCARLGLPYETPAHLQPPTTCSRYYGLPAGTDVSALVAKYGAEFGIKEGFGWGGEIPGMPELYFHAGTRVYDVNVAEAEALTHAEIEGRRQVRAVCDLLRAHANPEGRFALASLPAVIGIRETRHICCAYRLTEEDVLNGVRFNDAIANGSYRVDVHHDDKPGITFRYLDGREIYVRQGFQVKIGRWRPETAENPTFYQIPYRTMQPTGPYDNLLVAGRSVDADQGAFGAIRVMVNTNQMGEAAGVAAVVAARDNVPLRDIDTGRLRTLLGEVGAAVI